MACDEDHDCSMCSIPSVRRLVEMCTQCTKKQPDWQYAAINSYTPAIGLPVIPQRRLFTLKPKTRISCVSDLSPLSSFLSVMFSMNEIRDIVHFGKPASVTYADLIQATNSTRTCTDGTTIAVEFKYDEPYMLHTHNGDKTWLYNKSTTGELSNMLRDSTTVCWHWTGDSSWTAGGLQSNSESLWLTHNACNRTQRMRWSGTVHRVSAVPLHSDPESGDVIMFNIGIPELDISNCSEGIQADNARSIASEVLDCVMKDGRCFSCSRIIRLHDRVKQCERPKQARVTQVQLSDQFAQCLTLR